MNKNTILKGLLPLAVFPLLFWGCSDDKFGSDSSSGKQISFRLQGNLPSSRTTSTTIENINAFVVNAQVKAKAGDHSLDDDAGLLFTSQTVARLEGTANAFDYSPKRYYPDAAEKAYYSAYSPVTKNVEQWFNKNPDLDKKNEIAYRVLAPDKEKGNTTQEDLLVAYTPVIGKAVTLGAAPVHRDGFESPVQLTFKHALSRVFVRASNNNKEPVVIKELSLNNLYSKGTLKIDDKAWTGDGSYTPDGSVASINAGYIKQEDIASADDPYKVLWTPVEEPKINYPYVLLETGVSVPAGTEGSPVYIVGKDQGMLVLPQTTVNSNNGAVPTTATDFYVEVTYRLSNIQRTVRAAFTDINGLPDAKENGKGLTFEMGRQYALTLAFTDAAVEFDISVEGWEESETDAYAATTVVFNENKPEDASDSDAVEHIHAPNSGFIYGQDLPGLLPDTPPTLPGYIFQGYFDAPVKGKKYYDSGLVAQKHVDTNGDGDVNENDEAVWDKAGPEQILYAQWEEFNPFFAQSNIYFKPDQAGGFVGSLTFFEKDASKSGYQGLYFKWGSLIGVAAGAKYDAFDGTTYLYIPDVNSGKYYKVPVSDVKTDYNEGVTAEMTVAVRTFAANSSVAGWTGNGGNDWPKIPYVYSGATNDRSVNYLASVHTPTAYKGDICKFLTDTKGTNGSGLKKSWMMPRSIDFGENETYYPEQNVGGFVDITPDGTGKASAFAKYDYDDQTASFPSSGSRNGVNGYIDWTGEFAAYWSCSSTGGTVQFILRIEQDTVDPGSNTLGVYGQPVRCVQEL
jgi:hypothetical protein